MSVIETEASLLPLKYLGKEGCASVMTQVLYSVRVSPCPLGVSIFTAVRDYLVT